MQKTGKIDKTIVKYRVIQIVKEDGVPVEMINRLNGTLKLVDNEARHNTCSKRFFIKYDDSTRFQCGSRNIFSRYKRHTY